MVQHRLRGSVRSGQGCSAPELVGALSILALPMHVILVIGPSLLQNCMTVSWLQTPKTLLPGCCGMLHS